MNSIHDFDDIRPFLPEELPGVYAQLLSDEQFRKVATMVMPDIPFNTLAELIQTCKSNLEFQLKIGHSFVAQLLRQHSSGVSADFATLDIVNQRYTFISNHRDIVLDSAILAKMLVDNGCPTTCEIAIGDNLLSLPWVEKLVRINKSFVVHRSLPPREMLLASQHLCEYIHYVVNHKPDNVWIAQREGRAKDSDDRTQPAIVKMLAMAPRHLKPLQRLAELHIVPLAIAYEYDPCDYLKAREMQLRRDNPTWKKSAADDVQSMHTGIVGKKGRIAYRCAPCLDSLLHDMQQDYDNADKHTQHALYEQVAARIDHEIHRNYTIFPNNAVALDWLCDLQHDNTRYTDGVETNRICRYTSADVNSFQTYIRQQLQRIDLPQKNEHFLLCKLLTMYANPYKNYLHCHQQA